MHWHKSLTAALSPPAEGGDRHRRDGARPAAGEARAGERRGGRRRRRRGDGRQSGGLELVLGGRRAGGRKKKNIRGETWADVVAAAQSDRC